MDRKNIFRSRRSMGKKGVIGLCVIWSVAVLAILAATFYGRVIKINYIEQIHLQDGNLYYVDRGEGEDLKIIRSDPSGNNGDMHVVKRHEKEQFQMVRQIFFDSEGEAYVLIVKADVESGADVSCKVYKCDFAHGKLIETSYDLTEDVQKCGSIQIVRIEEGGLYYIYTPDVEKGSAKAELTVLNAQGERQVLDEVKLKYPYLNAQFFLSEGQVLLWMDYAGEVYAKEVGAKKRLKIEGITGRPGVFKSLSDDGTHAYVLDYEKECIRAIDLNKRESQALFVADDIRAVDEDFTFQQLQSPDCTQSGFCAGVKDAQGMVSICSYQEGKHQDIDNVSLTFPTILRRMFWVYIEIFQIAAFWCVIWVLRVKYHFQTILIRLGFVFLFGLMFMDSFLEGWTEVTMLMQLECNQTTALSALGKILKENIAHDIELEDKELPTGDRALRMDHVSDKEGGIGGTSMYVYSVFEADEDGHLYVSESMSEYSGVPVEWVYAKETSEAIYQAFDTSEVVDKGDEDMYGKRNNHFEPIVLNDGTRYGVLAVSADGNALDYQVWYYQRYLKKASSVVLMILTVVIMVILYISLKPLKALKRCAGALAAGNLGVTVAVHGHDEVANISAAFNQMSLEISNYVQDIKGMSDGYYKFIPAKILDLLGKESIQEVELGDEMTGEFTILSLHALDYPKQSASFSAEQAYKDINRVLSMLVEPINSHHGVVEHFEDTGLSAFFVVSSGEALDAAIDIQRLLEERMPGNGRTIAISYGRVMIGVIGHEQRMETTTISAHSDLAKELRLKGDKYGAHILITHLVYEQIADFEEHYHARYLGNIYLAANNTYERVYDVYDGDAEEEFYYKDLTKPLFEKGVDLFVAKKFYEARLVFVEVLKQYRKDKAAKEYLYRCDKYYRLADTEEIETVIEKF